VTWSNLQAEIADLFDGQSRRDRWDSSSGALDNIAHFLPSGISRRERAELSDLERRASNLRALPRHYSARDRRAA
jgi:hypothetical protein